MNVIIVVFYYYVGKKQTKETTLAGVLADENVLPGTITTEKTTYQAGETFSARGIVSESESYFAGLDAKSDNAAFESSSPRFLRAPVHAKMVATEFVDVSSPFKCL